MGVLMWGILVVWISGLVVVWGIMEWGDLDVGDLVGLGESEGCCLGGLEGFWPTASPPSLQPLQYQLGTS